MNTSLTKMSNWEAFVIRAVTLMIVCILYLTQNENSVPTSASSEYFYVHVRTRAVILLKFIDFPMFSIKVKRISLVIQSKKC